MGQALTPLVYRWFGKGAASRRHPQRVAAAGSPMAAPRPTSANQPPRGQEQNGPCFQRGVAPPQRQPRVADAVLQVVAPGRVGAVGVRRPRRAGEGVAGEGVERPPRLRAQHRVRLEEQQQRPRKRAPEGRPLLVVEVRVPVERLVDEHAVHLVPTQQQRARRDGARERRLGEHGVGVARAVQELHRPAVDRQHRAHVG